MPRDMALQVKIGVPSIKSAKERQQSDTLNVELAVA
jgi:hypothetical protein